MTSTKPATASAFVRAGRLCALLLFALLPSWQARAQTGGAAPPNNAAGRPAGSYQLGGFDNVNLFNGNLNFSLPLLQVGGRGGAQVPLTLSVDSTKWKLGRDGGVENTSATLNLHPENAINATAVITDTAIYELWQDDDGLEKFFGYYSAPHEVIIDRLGGGLISGGGTLTQPRFFILDPDGWQGAEAGYGPGLLQGRIAFRRSGRYNQVTSRLTRLVFTAPDGTELELRDRVTYGRPFLTGQTNPPRGRVFVSADGTAATFIADAPVTDNPLEMDAAPAGDLEENLFLFAPDGFLLFANGTRYRVDGGLVSWIRDHNGNLITFDYDAGGRVVGIADSLGRVVTVGYFDRPDPADPTKAVRDYDLISFAGFGGQPRSIRVRHGRLSEGGVLRADFPAGDSYRTRGNLFPQYEQGAEANLVFDADVVTAVELPDGRRYEILYNHHGEVARVALPTGGAVEYDYRADYSSVSVQRAVSRRRVYEGGVGVTQSGDIGTPTLTQTYTSERTGSVNNQPYRTAVTAEQWQGPDGTGGTLLARERHHFRGWANSVQAGFYAPALEGREEKAETLDTTGDTATAVVLRSVTYDWRQRPVSPDSPHEGWNNNVPRDLRMVEAVTTLENGLSSKTTSVEPGSSTGEVGFDRYNNRTGLWEYDYKAEGEAWRLLRHTRTKYVQTTAVGGTTYDYACDPATTCAQPTDSDDLIHLRRLPEYMEVTDGVTGGVVSRSEFLYDEPAYSSDEYGNLPTGFPGWASTGTAARGNLTTTGAWLNTLGAHNNPLAYLQTHTRYDRFGNVTKAWDTGGNASEVEFSAAYKYGFPTTVTSADPDGDGPLTPLVATSVYDFSSGLITEATDANNQTTCFDYEAGAGKLDRLKRVRHPDGGWTSYDYGDQPGSLFLHTKTLREAGPPEKVLESYQFFDGLGRAIRSTSRTGEATWSAATTEYDAFGRPVRVTNPYETAEHMGPISQTALWTKTRYDALGRAWEVETPDGAKVITHFDGDRTLVTDQSGKQRLSKVDALGHLTEVWEVRSPDPVTGTEAVTFPHHDDIPDVAAGYRTAYAYDALGNLRKVKQGEQRRYFAYDSLSRLLRAKNPEQTPSEATLESLRLPEGLVTPLSDHNNDWTLKYEYDEVGNLRWRTDARATRTEYVYDALNRVTLRDYSDSTPNVTYTYGDDAGANTKGRLLSVSSSVSTYSYDGHDAMGRVTASSQTTGGVTYTMPEYRYDKAGNLIAQKYPSGKIVETRYDEAGRVAGVKRQGGDYYAGGDPGEAGRPNVIRYAVHGGVSALRLGNRLWEHTLYNKRLQPYEIGLGTSRTDSSVLKLEYGYGLTGATTPDSAKNNGNVRGQRISVPAGDGAPAQTFTQVYTYDALNRLVAAEETAEAAINWRQVYSYDRFGNRRLDPMQTTSPKLTVPGQTAVPALANPSLHLATNRIAEDQDGDGKKEYTYDEAGNLTCDAQRCIPSLSPTPYYGYDAEGLLVAAGGGYEVGGSSYVYDGNGRRVRKAAYGGEVTVFVYDVAGRLVAEYSNQSGGSGTRYMTQDHLDSTRVVTDAQGNAHSNNEAGGSRHDYFPFGEELVAGMGGRLQIQGYVGNVDRNRKRWAQLERDDETGLDYAQARYYNAKQGRFISPDEFSGDPVEVFSVASSNPTFYSDLNNPQSLNKYQYCLNNPLRYIDPYGHQTQGGESSGLTEWFRALVRKFVEQIRPEETTQARDEEGRGNTLIGNYANGDDVVAQYLEKSAEGLDVGYDAIEFIDPTGGVGVMHSLAKQDNTGAAFNGLFMIGGTGKGKKLERLAESQLLKRFEVILGKAVAASDEMADFLAIAKSKKSSVVMEVSTGSKEIKKLEAQLRNGIRHMLDQGVRGDSIKVYFRTNNRRLADKVRKELPKVEGREVRVILDR